MGKGYIFWGLLILLITFGVSPAPCAENLLPNGNFEEWGDYWYPAGWYRGSTIGYSDRDEKEVFRGKYSLKLRSPDYRNQGEVPFSYQVTGKRAGELAGKIVSFGVWFRAGKGKSNAMVRILDYIPGEKAIWDKEEKKYKGTQEWQFITVSKKIRNKVSIVRFQFAMETAGGNDGYFDEAVACIGKEIPQELKDHAGGGPRIMDQE